MPTESNISDSEIKVEEPKSQTIKPIELEIEAIEEIEKENNILVDEEQQKEAAYGFLGGGSAGAIVAAIANSITSRLGQNLTTIVNAVEQLTNAETAFTQSANVVENILKLIKTISITAKIIHNVLTRTDIH